MTPQNQPTPNMPEIDKPELTPEQLTPKTPEKAPEPVSPEIPQKEVFGDQQSVAAPIPEPNVVPEPPVQPQPTSEPNLEEQEVDEDSSEMNNEWVNAVETVIEKDEGKPYEEEEDSEKLQVNYLAKRFGKKIDKE